MKKIILFVLFLFLFGCSTSYQSIGVTGGFTETRLNENIFRVSFRGNGFTSSEQAADFALLRSAELTLLYGYKYFIVIDNSEVVDVNSYTTPVTSYTTVYGNTAQTYYYGGATYNISRPSSTNVIACFHEKPTDTVLSFDAEFLYNQLTTKYEIY